MEQIQDVVDIEKGTSELPVSKVEPTPAIPEFNDRQVASAKTINTPTVESLAPEVFKEMVKQQGVEAKAALNLATFGAGVAEDVYNFGVDVINFADSKFGDGKDFLKYSDTVSQWQPNDVGSNMARESIKLIIGYSTAMKAMQGMSPQTLAKIKYAPEALAGFMSEMVLLKPEGEPLLKQFLGKVPVVNEWMDYLHSDGDGTGFEKRLRNSLYGVVEGGIVDGLMKVAKSMRSIYKASDNIEPPPVPAASKSTAESGSSAAPTETPPPIPVENPMEPILQGSHKATEIDNVKAKEISDRYFAGEGNMNVAQVGPDNYLDLTSMDVDNDTRRIVDLVVQANKESFDKISMNSPEIIQAARDMDMTPEALMNFEVDAGFPRGTIVAAQAVVNEASGALKVLASKYKNGDISKEQWVQAIANHTQLTSKLKDMRSLGGALLQESQIPVGNINTTQKTKDLARIFGENPDLLADELVKPDTKIENIAKAFKDLTNNVADSLVQIRYAGLLSSPLTHMRNIYGGVTTTLMRPAESVLAATINAMQGGRAGGVTFGEAYHETLGIAQGFLDAISISAKRLRGQADVDFLGIDPRHAKLPQYLNQSKPIPDSKSGKALYYMTEMLGSSKIGKALQMEDNFIKHINAMATLKREAYLKGYNAKQSGASAEEVANVIRAEINNPSAATKSKMYADAEYVTFTNDVKGSLFKSLETISRSNPLGRLVAPFAKVNLNVMRYTLERIPGANLLMDGVARDLFTHPNPAVRQRTAAKMSFSSMTLASLAYYMHSQDAIIGSGSSNPAKRKLLEQAGYQQGAIRIGDEWVEIRKETPVGAILSFMADMAELTDALPENEQGVIGELGTYLAATVAQLYNPEYLTDSVAKLVDVFQDPSKEGGKAAYLFGSDLATSFLPYSAAARHFNRQVNPEKSEVYTPASMLNTTMNKIKEIYAPYLNATKRNMFGDPIIHKQGLGPDIISPFGLTKQSNDPVLKEMSRLSDTASLLDARTSARETGTGSVVQNSDPSIATFQMPAKSFVDPRDGDIIKLGTHDYEKMVVLAAGREFEETENGLKIKPEGENSLRNTLKNIIQSDSYKDLHDMDKIAIVKGIVSDYRKMAIDRYVFTDVAGKVFNKNYRKIKEMRLKQLKDLRN